MINQNFTQQILRSSRYRRNLDLPNPFWDEEDNDGMEPASVAYRYRRFDLGDGVSLVARTELHGLARDRQKADTSRIVANVSSNKKKKVGSGRAAAGNPPDDAPEGDQYMVSAARAGRGRLVVFFPRFRSICPKASLFPGTHRLPSRAPPSSIRYFPPRPPSPQTAFALNEYDPSYGGGSAAPPARPGAAINWREKIDSQAG